MKLMLIDSIHNNKWFLEDSRMQKFSPVRVIAHEILYKNDKMSSSKSKTKVYWWMFDLFPVLSS